MEANIIAGGEPEKKTNIFGREKIKFDRDKNELLSAITDAKNELDLVSRNINFVSDTLLVDHYTFKLKAAEARYRYLVSQAKQMGLEDNRYVERMYNERYTK